MGDSNVKRDSKDPQPTSRNSARVGGGNVPYPAGSEKHGQAKAEHVSVASRFDKNKPGPEQPTRNKGGKTTEHGVPQSGGNVAATNAVEDHNQRKSEHVRASQRY
jgi:hypothetical protein